MESFALSSSSSRQIGLTPGMYSPVRTVPLGWIVGGGVELNSQLPWRSVVSPGLICLPFSIHFFVQFAVVIGSCRV